MSVRVPTWLVFLPILIAVLTLWIIGIHHLFSFIEREIERRYPPPKPSSKERTE